MFEGKASGGRTGVAAWMKAGVDDEDKEDEAVDETGVVFVGDTRDLRDEGLEVKDDDLLDTETGSKDGSSKKSDRFSITPSCTRVGRRA